MPKSSSTKKIWNFFWKDDSIWSWLANIIVAFLIIFYIVYPLLGVVLGTSFPIVAVISESMEHGLHDNDLCGKSPLKFQNSFDNYWDECGSWYESNGITKEEFKAYPLKNGFDKGDVVVLWRANRDNLEVGDILIFQGSEIQPIIHRVVRINEENGAFLYQTKGDHNKGSDHTEMRIDEERIFGKGILRVPYLGWVKILAVDAVRPLGIVIER